MGKLTPAQRHYHLRQARYHLRALGLSFEGLPSPQRHGRPARNDDDALLPMLELFLRLARQDRGMDRDAALRWFVSSCETKEGKQILGASTDAVVKRLRKKLKAIGAAGRPLKWTTAAYADLDPSKVKLVVNRRD